MSQRPVPIPPPTIPPPREQKGSVRLLCELTFSQREQKAHDPRTSISPVIQYSCTRSAALGSALQASSSVCESRALYPSPAGGGAPRACVRPLRSIPAMCAGGNGSEELGAMPAMPRQHHRSPKAGRETVVSASASRRIPPGRLRRAGMAIGRRTASAPWPCPA